MVLRLSDLGSMEPRVLPPEQKDDRDEEFRCVDDVFHINCEDADECNKVTHEKVNTNDITRQNQTNSPLLRLPAELRNKIYKYIFHGSLLHINKPRIRKDVLGCFPSIRSIVYTCRQLYSEARILSFTMCIFQPSYFALRFLSASNLPAGAFGQIRHMFLTAGNGEAIFNGKMDKTDIKEEFWSLQSLVIEPWSPKVSKVTSEGVKSKMRAAFGLPQLMMAFVRNKFAGPIYRV